MHMVKPALDGEGSDGENPPSSHPLDEHPPPSAEDYPASCGASPSSKEDSVSTARGTRARASAPALNPYRITHCNFSEPGGRSRGGPSRSDATSASANERSEAANGSSEDSCPRPITVQRTDRRTGEVEGVELPCGCKTCPHCGPKKRRKLVAHYVRVFSELPSLQFVTLTVDPKMGIPADDSAAFIKDRWERRFVKRVKRRTEGELKYVASIELHEDGSAHLHAVMSTTVGEDELRNQWFESGGGVVMEAEPVQKGRNLSRRVGYVLKYAFEGADEVDGNSVLASEGVGYNSKEAKEARQRYAEEKGDYDPGRYVYEGPNTGGRRSSQSTITEADRRRFRRLQESARSVQYIRWEDQDRRHLPRDGVRIVYDRSTGSTTREPVRKVKDGSGGTKIVDLESWP